MNAPVHPVLPTELSPEEEAKRLAAVRRYGILDTPPDGCFDRVTAIAARLFAVPISIISLVDHDRIWFKSHHGLETEQISRDPGLCASAILQEDPWVLTDARRDVRALANPLVAGEFGLRFYVGIPLRTSDGYNLGTLCVIDREPRTVSEAQIAHLKDLASVVMDQMELRLSACRTVGELSQAIAEKDAALRRTELMAKEIDHRVMNSLQLISGLLGIQSRGLGESEAAEQLALAASRVTAIARVHRHIYSRQDAEHADCGVYLRRLCGDLSGMLHSLNRGEIIVEAIDVEIPTKRIVPLGLIASELVTNAAKHGSGRIRVTFERTAEDGYALSVSDEGKGLPADYDPTAASGLGMKVISTLVRQLGGELVTGSMGGAGGARFTVLFSGSDESPQDPH
jgi:two-component sensor histidine kinase